ncbi:MAG: radical SAM protein [Candidatus Electrothrix sp. GW3-4]|uniref:radical SAM/SPASM domain-containing protein n=1 Tax=Candidatus Electrothrix sp. GW3-4 TaxID=3126740 RepID=UPI0030D370A7
MESDEIDRYLARAAGARIPISASFELTHRCNFRCVHCYLGDQKGIWQYRHKELNTEAIIRLLDEMVEAGTLFLTLTGGDPMLRDDFLTVYEYAVRSGLLVSVYCNGTSLSDSIVRLFTRYPPRAVDVTLYGANAKTFESITQKVGSFTLCLNGIKRLVGEKIRLRLKAIVMTLNHQELSAMWEMAEKLGVPFRHDSSIIPVLPNEDNHAGCTNMNDGTGRDRPQDILRFRLPYEEAVEADFAIDKVRNELQKLITARSDVGSFRDKLYYCGAGRSSYHVTPYGKMQPCIISPHFSYDLLAGRTISDVWSVMSNEFPEQKAPPSFACSSCQSRSFCAGCPSNFVLETGVLNNVVSFYCKSSSLRKKKALSSDNQTT